VASATGLRENGFRPGRGIGISAAPAGAGWFGCRFRWLTPPANFRGASGSGNVQFSKAFGISIRRALTLALESMEHEVACASNSALALAGDSRRALQARSTRPLAPAGPACGPGAGAELERRSVTAGRGSSACGRGW